MEIPNTPMTPAQAWAHFWENGKKDIWKTLSHTERNRLIQANRDSLGLRIETKTGKRVNLGTARIERILTEFAPGRYRFVHHTDVFLENETP